MDVFVQKVLLYIVKILHWCYFFSVLIVPIVFAHPILLSFMVMAILVNYYFWYVYNECPLNFVEEYLGEPPHIYEHVEKKKSHISVWIETCLGLSEQQMYTLSLIVPIISAFICLVKINWNIYGKTGVSKDSASLPPTSAVSENN